MHPQPFHAMRRAFAKAFASSIASALLGQLALGPVALGYVALGPVALAQVAPSHGKGNPNAPTPSWDIFAGYSVMDPLGTFHPVQPDGTMLPVTFKLEKTGTVESAAHYFGRSIGLQVESGQHDLARNTGFLATGSSNSGIFTLGGGLIYRWPGVHLTPFVHGLGGAADVDGPDHEPYTWGPVVIGGGGLDWYFGCHFGVRVLEADYEFLHANSGVSHGTLAAGNFVWADDENINAIRLAAGVVVRGASAWSPMPGCAPLPPVEMTCTASNGAIYPGEPVTLTAVALGLNPRLNAVYTWTGSGVTGAGETATVDTATLPPGTYIVRARVSEGKKASQSAECETSFTVKRYEPPTLACAAGPMLLHPDQTSSVTLTALSPQNRPLTYACTASAGTVTVTGNVATFSPSPGQSGAVMINCTATDDKGQRAVCSTAVTVEQPPPPLPRVKPLCTIDFSQDAARPARVTNEAKACLDDIALYLKQDPDSRLVIVGEQNGEEAQGSDTMAAQRAVNTKEYLTTEKGIDPSRISVVTGAEQTKTVVPYLAPAGSSFTSQVQDTTPVDEKLVKPVARTPLPVRARAHTPAGEKKPGSLQTPAGRKKPARRRKPTGNQKPAPSKGPAKTQTSAGKETKPAVSPPKPPQPVDGP